MNAAFKDCVLGQLHRSEAIATPDDSLVVILLLYWLNINEFLVFEHELLILLFQIELLVVESASLLYLVLSSTG